MKKYFIGYLFIGFLVLMGCKKETVSYIDPAGEYAVNFGFPEGEIHAPAKIVLTNRSKYSDRFEWQFEGAKLINSDQQVYEASTSTAIVPDTLFYELPGTYTVTLTAWQDGHSETISKEVEITKMQPVIVPPENIAVMLDLTFSAQAFQYPGQSLSYSWDFGEAGTSTEANPTVQFLTEGEHTVTLTINDGEETLTTNLVINVQGELAKAIFFADALTRKVYRYKLNVLTPSAVEDIGVTTGYNAFGLSIKGNVVYLSETGLGTRYNTDATVADGVLRAFNIDGSGQRVISKPVHGGDVDYRFDPWMNTVDQYGNIWWTTRNWGVFVMNASATDAPYPSSQGSFRFRITADIAGESVTTFFPSDIKEVGDEMWVSAATAATGKGIYKFGYNGAYIGKFSTAIQSYAIRAFVVDQVNGHIYFAHVRSETGRPAGIYRADLDGSNVIPIDNGTTMQIGAGGFSNQGADNEYIYITNIDVDVEGGYLYYGYRANTDVSGSGNPPTFGPNANNSGIKRYKLDGSENPEFLFQGYAPYGLAIDHVKR